MRQRSEPFDVFVRRIIPDHADLILAEHERLSEALLWISEYPNRVLPHQGQEEHAVELAEHARDALALHDEVRR